MAYIRGDSASYFSADSYQVYVDKKGSVCNERLRGKDETFFDAMLSEEADISRLPEGNEIIELIRNLS
ncbi:MAG: hypothetical protein LBU88_07455 [Treponema sp.]|jgi:hypothetical protein|nr:hypothetical protein [Treponema sp.]